MNNSEERGKTPSSTKQRIGIPPKRIRPSLIKAQELVSVPGISPDI
jgi:hypothetical protein